ncbi:purine-cytosine permease family protein [Nonomuraea muscovyensis]|uniref:Cytosine permease n=1 Tax=Nonomuraea muscovyensis TaxID=1124761 RepID=A0A7X0EX78_9ACTN|nr:cytosine permease [Nonomuraea muscovyensis]MBB6347313.1 cytosine permease [Nonomuraea muscovyensis]MDF2705010.1 Permease [Nonomuraea muscovyensis]
MTRQAPPAASAGDHDDYALERVPTDRRYSWFSVATQRFGQLSALAQFLLGATLGLGMSFWDAVLAITVGSVLLEIVTVFVGIAGMREGLSTSVLARWCGFGRKGSAIIGLLITLSLIGWFGVQNAVFASGLHSLVGTLPVWAWALLGGAAVTAIVVYGFGSMAWTAYLTVPAFLAVAAFSIGSQLMEHDLGALISAPPPGQPLTLAQGATIVAGGFIVGAVMTPDMTRYNRSVADVVKQTVVGVTLGEYVVGLIGVLLAHAARSSDIVMIITTSSGLIGTVVLVASILKINDWNLYSSSLGLVNAVDVLFGKRLSRAGVTLAIGAVGSILSAVGILTHFVPLLTFIGILTPPVAGIMIAEYFVVRTWRKPLAESAARGALPDSAPDWVPVSLLAWALAALVGYTIEAGIPAVNSLATAFVVYAVLGKVIATRSKAAVAAPAHQD